ncbi:MAG: hypothetical protein M2R45_02320 [Verrucomicrobia subdivision 3 bacterium]|nr:hypothetical protein [Limisphaerales bacterium]MCS1414699.1 hypothetical protein [Limisphaerales bacterium]
MGVLCRRDFAVASIKPERERGRIHGHDYEYLNAKIKGREGKCGQRDAEIAAVAEHAGQEQCLLMARRVARRRGEDDEAHKRIIAVVKPAVRIFKLDANSDSVVRTRMKADTKR